MRLSLVLVLVSCIFVQSFDISKLEIASYNGKNNNKEHKIWGSKGSVLLKNTGNFYADGVSEPRGGGVDEEFSLVSPRVISNVVSAHVDGDTKIKSKFGSDLLAFYGQWLAHEVVTVLNHEPCESFNISVPQYDIPFNPTDATDIFLPFCRSEYKIVDGVRRQVNQVTAWLDASNVYSSEKKRAKLLSRKNGKLKVSFPRGKKGGEYFPRNKRGGDEMMFMGNDANRVPNTYLFAAGDFRSNENVVLSAFHLLFVREHNRIVSLLPNKYSSKQKFEIARKYIIAFNQQIVYGEYLPMIRGRKFPKYKGYDPTLNPDIETAFNVAALRFGHSMIPSVIERFDKNWEESKPGHLLLRDAYFWPDALTSAGVEDIWRGLIVSKPSAVDGKVIDDLRNHLFGRHTNTEHAGHSVDLMAINIQRGRDHGLGSYNDVRVAMGLEPCEDIDCITEIREGRQKLKEAYGSVDELDAFIGGLMEDHSRKTVLGEMFDRVVEDQMIRLREGDRFYYENDPFWSKADLREIRQTSLADLLVRNSNGEIPFLPKNAFALHDMHEIVKKENALKRLKKKKDKGLGTNDLDGLDVDYEDLEDEQCVDHTTINFNWPTDAQFPVPVPADN